MNAIGKKAVIGKQKKGKDVSNASSSKASLEIDDVFTILKKKGSDKSDNKSSTAEHVEIPKTKKKRKILEEDNKESYGLITSNQFKQIISPEVSSACLNYFIESFKNELIRPHWNESIKSLVCLCIKLIY